MEGLDRLLKEHPFLVDLSEEQIRFIAGCARNARFGAGEFVFREGTDADAMYLVRTGRIALELHLPGRGSTSVETLREGDVFGSSWLFPPYRWALDARTVEPSRILAFDGPCLRRKMEADPAFGFVIAKRLLRQLQIRLDRARLQRLDVYGPPLHGSAPAR
jgi:CRP/FNR family cyclic AMP-dependent transcriptional regulator